jgi:nucleoside-diphosphate-sugar epimerase
MIYVVGGSGYVGTHLVLALNAAGFPVTIVDPLAPPVCFHDIPYTKQTGSDITPDANESNVVYWLAGPRNHSSPREVELLSFLLERDFERFCATQPRARLVLVSSMSVEDDPDNTYAQHKRNMEAILLKYPNIESIVVRPGTVIGAVAPCPLLRKDLGVHAVLRSLVEQGEAWVNLELVRAYTTMEELITTLLAARVFIPGTTLIEAYLTVAPMSALFTELHDEGLHYGRLPGLTVNFNGRGRFSTVRLKEVQREVVRTSALIRTEQVVWV